MEKHAFITLQFVVEQESTTVDSNCMHPKVWSHGYINSSIKLKQQMNKQINSRPVFSLCLVDPFYGIMIPWLKHMHMHKYLLKLAKILYAMEYIHGGNKQDQHDDDAWQWQTATCVWRRLQRRIGWNLSKS